MSFIPLSRIAKLSVASLLLLSVSCAHHSTTQENIKKVNDAFQIKNKNEAPITASVEVSQKKTEDTPGSIPLSQFLDAKTATVLQSRNPWFSRVQDWAKTYVEIAKSERDVRNYDLSEKYSGIALIWAHRALQIKDLPTDGAIIKTKIWLEQLAIPKPPERSSYFAADDVYAKILITQGILAGFKNRLCLIKRGVPIIYALAFMELSVDLYAEKKYSKALYKIQSALGSVESVTKDDDEKCEERDAAENAVTE